ncbi:MAG: hypothetical protein ABI859_18115, partial [Pseudomonadota bacterium]
MIATYAFLMMFTVQILTMSVLHPARLAKFTRAKLANHYDDERFARLYPGTERAGVERFLTGYRAVNTGIAVLGLLLLGWLFKYMQRPDWDDGPIEALVGVFVAVQTLPLVIVWLISARINRQALERSSLEAKHKAILQRRGLFDFVSPVTVSIAVLVYVLFAAFVFYIQGNPFKGFAGPLINLGAITLVYMLNAFVLYAKLYGRRSSPLETRADRTYWTGVTVKLCIYSCIACVVFLSLNFALALLNLQRWEPFALSVYLVTCALLC